MKLAPLIANLSLGLPQFSDFFELGDNATRDQITHALRHCGIYYAAALILNRLNGPNWPSANVRNTSLFILVASAAAGLAAVSGVSLHALVSNFSWVVAGEIVVHWAIGDAVAALVIPPIMIPALRAFLGSGEPQTDWTSHSDWLIELGVILGAMILATALLILDPELGSLWYITLLPPIFAGVRLGMNGAAVSAFLTASLTPIAAKVVPYNGEPLALSVLLAITAIASFLVGAAVSVQQDTLSQLDGQNRALEDTVAARTKELAEAYEFERHLVRSLGHDLRQPLQTITMLVESMTMRKDNKDPVLDALHQISGTMTNFLDGVLNYALTAPGTVKPNLVPTTVCSVFSPLEAIYRPIAEKRGVTLVIPRFEADFVTDEVLVRQALSNDLDNAIRLSAPGTIVSLRHETRGGRHALIVADEIAVEYAHSPGTAGFGYGIVARVCTVLGADRIKEKNIRGILLPTV